MAIIADIPIPGTNGPGRFRNPIGKYRVSISAACDNCGKCVDLCPHEVYRKGARKPRVINEHFCVGHRVQQGILLLYPCMSQKGDNGPSQPLLRGAR